MGLVGHSYSPINALFRRRNIATYNFELKLQSQMSITALDKQGYRCKPVFTSFAPVHMLFGSLNKNKHK